MTAYDTTCSPPAPIISVQIQNPATGQSETFNALIDSGASISVVPEHVITKLNIKPIGSLLVQGLQSQPQESLLYSSTWVVEGYVCLGMEYIELAREIGILGRDILQHFILILDGKAEQFTISA